MARWLCTFMPVYPVMCVMFLGLTDWLHMHMQELIQSWHRHNATAFGNHPLPFQHEFPRTVWLLWLAGWDSAPWVVREVAASYERHNPGWNIVRLDNLTLRDYVEIDYIDKPNIDKPAKADILRIALLAEHGGVWADATVLCYAPLDSWIHGALIPQDFWMYHARDGGKGPSSWFMAATKGSHLMQSWKAAVDKYWGARDWAHDYFWMDGLFKDLMDWDPNFLAQWQQVPYMYGEAEGQSAMLPWQSMTTNDEDIKRILHKRPPYVLKLSHHGFPDETLASTQEMNGYFAIMQSYRMRSVCHNMEKRSPKN